MDRPTYRDCWDATGEPGTTPEDEDRLPHAALLRELGFSVVGWHGGCFGEDTVRSAVWQDASHTITASSERIYGVPVLGFATLYEDGRIVWTAHLSGWIPFPGAREGASVLQPTSPETLVERWLDPPYPAEGDFPRSGVTLRTLRDGTARAAFETHRSLLAGMPGRLVQQRATDSLGIADRVVRVACEVQSGGIALSVAPLLLGTALFQWLMLSAMVSVGPMQDEVAYRAGVVSAFVLLFAWVTGSSLVAGWASVPGARSVVVNAMAPTMQFGLLAAGVITASVVAGLDLHATLSLAGRALAVLALGAVVSLLWVVFVAKPVFRRWKTPRTSPQIPAAELLAPVRAVFDNASHSLPAEVVRSQTALPSDLVGILRSVGLGPSTTELGADDRVERWRDAAGTVWADLVPAGEGHAIVLRSELPDGTFVETRSLPTPGPSGALLREEDLRRARWWPAGEALSVLDRARKGLQVQFAPSVAEAIARHPPGVPKDEAGGAALERTIVALRSTHLASLASEVMRLAVYSTLAVQFVFVVRLVPVSVWRVEIDRIAVMFLQLGIYTSAMAWARPNDSMPVVARLGNLCLLVFGVTRLLGAPAPAVALHLALVAGLVLVPIAVAQVVVRRALGWLP